MEQRKWVSVDRYYKELFIGQDDALDSALKNSAKHELPQIAVSAAQGKFLNLLVKTSGAKRILEIGTLGGYSSLWMAYALGDDGKIITLEYETAYAEVAQENFENAGQQDKIEIKTGAATETMQAMIDQGEEPFDLIFMDADKPNNPNYFKLAMKLAKQGTIIIADNVVRDGEIVNADSEDEAIQGLRACNALIANEPRVTATTLQTVGDKGYDGFAFIRVEE